VQRFHGQLEYGLDSFRGELLDVFLADQTQRLRTFEGRWPNKQIDLRAVPAVNLPKPAVGRLGCVWSRHQCPVEGRHGTSLRHVDFQDRKGAGRQLEVELHPFGPLFSSRRPLDSDGLVPRLIDQEGRAAALEVGHEGVAVFEANLAQSQV
jgi:hypothetical protein